MASQSRSRKGGQPPPGQERKLPSKSRADESQPRKSLFGAGKDLQNPQWTFPLRSQAREMLMERAARGAHGAPEAAFKSL